MPTLEFETILNAPIEKVWAFYLDVKTNLPALSPPEDAVELLEIEDSPRVGGKVVISAKGPLGRIKWVAVYEVISPPKAVVFGIEARFVDYQESGPFKSFRHEHEFEAIDSKTTRQLDRVTYSVGYGPLGWVADFLIVRRKLNGMFAHRAKVIRELLGK